MSQGGKRKGAGRKPAPEGTKKIAITKKIDPELVAYLQSCENQTEVIETALRRSKDFRDWKKSQSG